MTKTAAPKGAETGVGLYELMIIWNPELRESEVKKELKELEETIVKDGGKITAQDFWGKRALAYHLKGRSEGIYMVYNAELPTSAVKEVKDSLRINKEVLRSTMMRLPDGFVYTKYDLTITDEPKLRKESPMMRKPSYSKPTTPMRSSAKPAAPEASEKKGQEANAAALDKKLDDIIGGTDLKL